jgi:type III pantothenate kinase
MNALYLDIGNTSLKLGKPGKGGWKVQWHQHIDTDFEQFIRTLTDNAAGGMVYISSVRKDITQKVLNAAPDLHTELLTVSQIPSRFINYSTVQTLGLDRFLSSLGAFHKSGRKSVIVIDTGSACTVDFMDHNGVYQGGVIMPGIEILKKTIRIHLPELPEIEPFIPNSWPGKSTQDSLRWGVNGMFAAAIENWIGKYRTSDKVAEIYLTGGNAADVKSLLTETEITLSSHLQFEGMKMFAEMVKG